MEASLLLLIFILSMFLLLHVEHTRCRILPFMLHNAFVAASKMMDRIHGVGKKIRSRAEKRQVLPVVVHDFNFLTIEQSEQLWNRT